MTRRWWSDLAPNTQGALLMTASGVTCSVIAAMVKELSLGGMDGFEIAFFRALIAFIGLLPFSPSPAALDAGPNTLASMSGAASWAAPLPIWVWALTHGIRMMPDGWTIGGATVIVGSTVYIAQREARLMRAGDFNAVKRKQSPRRAGGVTSRYSTVP